MSVKTYDPKQVIVIVGGSIIDGFADGTFVEAERDEDAFSLTIGTDGEGTRSKTNNKGGTVTLSLLQSSSANDILTGFAISDELNNGGIFPFLTQDKSGRSVLASETMWVQKLPPTPFSREAEVRTWILRTDNLEIFVGGN